MHVVLRPVLSGFLALILILPATAQQSPATIAPEAASLLQRALAALNSGATLTDVTLTGSARRIAGSDDESGTIVLKLLAKGASRVDFAFPSGSRSEIRNATALNPVGSWSGPDGVAHPVAYHNLLADSGFFPAFTLANFASSPNAVVTLVGPETHNGIAAIHLSASQPPLGLTGKAAELPQRLSQTEIFLDATSLFPTAITFNIHPDNNLNIDLAVETRFSDYRSINGVQIPFHIEKFLNNGLILDLQLQSATFNSGLTASDFTVGAAQ